VTRNVGVFCAFFSCAAPLGILVNPAFGTTTVNFATQLSLNLIDLKSRQ
jgi:hypothetical protein